ncbi:tyrosine-type recombinase/integrase [Streptomyces sp. NPDC053813]|uniref:tyrosine-type recombinase/integrase n=1 Tax=Streptomyces sp. NPDC053813 TaxID=3365717 RepID=UPI0037D41D53
MVDLQDPGRDLENLVLPEAGRLAETDDPWEPYRLLDPSYELVRPVAVYFADLQAAGTPATTIRSFGMDLLRWYRFLWVLEVEWNRATRAEARDFMRWMQIADKPTRVHWRLRGKETAGVVPAAKLARPEPGTPNPVTGKRTPGKKYAASTRAHSETVLRMFYDFHLDQGTGPIINPFPLDRSRRAGRANAHHNPLDIFAKERKGRYRPTVPKRIPRRIPEGKFNELFAALKYNRDRALLAFWVSTGARAEELLTARQADANPGEQLAAVVRKGSREIQRLPASPDAFVWLRLYQEEARRDGIPRGRHLPLWWTLRRPWRPLNYHAARAMLNRANGLWGANWSLHDLRHTASYCMARDPELPLTDVQWGLGHRLITTTQIYLPSSEDEVITSVLAHHARQARKRENPQPQPVAPGYDPASLTNLFGRPVS